LLQYLCCSSLSNLSELATARAASISTERQTVPIKFLERRASSRRSYIQPKSTTGIRGWRGRIFGLNTFCSVTSTAS
jgi:hypothetical protein